MSEGGFLRGRGLSGRRFSEGEGRFEVRIRMVMGIGKAGSGLTG